MTAPFKGSYTVTVTPFTEDGSALDIPRLKAFLDWQIEVGVPGVIVLGTTGEFLTVPTTSGPSLWKPSSSTAPDGLRCWWAP